MTDFKPIRRHGHRAVIYLSVITAFLSSASAFAQKRSSSPAKKNREISFDSGALIGGGLWLAPALPKLIEAASDAYGKQTNTIDIANYQTAAAAPFVLASMRLYYPLKSAGWPFGLQIQMSHAVSESPLLFFTLSPNKSSIRPQYALEGELGIRYDWLFSNWRTDLGLDLIAKRTFYLGANFTELGPSGRLRFALDMFSSKSRIFGLIPVLALELSGAPYLLVSGFDNRILTNGSGALREFEEVAYIANSSSALQYGVSIEAGGWWQDKGRSRQESLLLVYSFNATQYAGIIERKSRTAGQYPVDVTSTMHIFALSLKSSFF